MWFSPWFLRALWYLPASFQSWLVSRVLAFVLFFLGLLDNLLISHTYICSYHALEGPFYSTFLRTRKNCLWHSILAFWSPNITHFLASLHFFLCHFTGASHFGLLFSYLPQVVVGCPFPVVYTLKRICCTFSGCLLRIFLPSCGIFLYLTDFLSLYIVLLNLKQLSSLLYVLFLKKEPPISYYSFV